MEINSKKQLNFHFDVLPRKAKKALDFLSEQNWLRDPSWYLAGGSALALQAGHRRSVDLDFFSRRKDIDTEDLLRNFYGNKNWLVDIRGKNTVYGKLFGVKVSFIAYPFFIPKEIPKQYGFIRILPEIDIAAMKVIAISQREKKRDFFDLYWCVKNIKPLEDIVRRLKIQYPSVAHDYHHILKSLVYFDDAESDPEPKIYLKISWKEVKRFFIKEVPLIAEKLIR